jgi:NSS family neurotransmitter:Na+ symporter
VGLLLSGAFFYYAVVHRGVEWFREKQINVEGTDVRVGKWFNVFVPFLIPAEFLGLLGWWFTVVWPAKATFGASLKVWLYPFAEANVGTCLFQWAVVIVIFIILNKSLARWSLYGEVET